MSTATTEPPRQLVTFSVGDYHCGIVVLEVQEVLRPQRMTAVPLAPPAVRGLINLRGQILTVIEMRARLGLQPHPDAREQMNLIVSLRDGAASLVVDTVGDVIDLQPQQYKPRPSTLKREIADLVAGVYQVPHGLLLHLDAEQACRLFEEG